MTWAALVGVSLFIVYLFCSSPTYRLALLDRWVLQKRRDKRFARKHRY